MTPKEAGKKKQQLNKDLQTATGFKIDYKFLRIVDMQKVLKRVNEYLNGGGCK